MIPRRCASDDEVVHRRPRRTERRGERRPREEVLYRRRSCTSTQSAWMPTPFGATLTALNPRLATPSSAVVISALVRFCAMPHDEKTFIRYGSPNWSTTLRPDTAVGHRSDVARAGRAAWPGWAWLAGAGFVVDVVDDLGVDVEVVDVAGLAVVGLAVDGVRGRRSGAAPPSGRGPGLEDAAAAAAGDSSDRREGPVVGRRRSTPERTAPGALAQPGSLGDSGASSSCR